MIYQAYSYEKSFAENCLAFYGITPMIQVMRMSGLREVFDSQMTILPRGYRLQGSGSIVNQCCWRYV